MNEAVSGSPLSAYSYSLKDVQDQLDPEHLREWDIFLSDNEHKFNQKWLWQYWREDSREVSRNVLLRKCAESQQVTRVQTIYNHLL